MKPSSGSASRAETSCVTWSICVKWCSDWGARIAASWYLDAGQVDGEITD